MQSSDCRLLCFQEASTIYATWGDLNEHEIVNGSFFGSEAYNKIAHWKPN